MENGANGVGFGDSYTNQNNGNHLYINRSLEVGEPEHSASNWNLSLITEGLRYAEHVSSEALDLLSHQEKNLIHDHCLIKILLGLLGELPLQCQ